MAFREGSEKSKEPNLFNWWVCYLAARLNRQKHGGSSYHFAQFNPGTQLAFLGYPGFSRIYRTV